VANKEHPYERRVKALQEHIEHSIEIYEKFLRVEGRPAFNRELSPEEELVWYATPATREILLKSIENTEGPEAAERARERLDRRLAEWQTSEMGGAAYG